MLKFLAVTALCCAFTNFSSAQVYSSHSQGSRHVFQNGPWQCIDNVTDHDGELDAGCGAGVWACYESISRKCVNLDTGKTWQKSYRHYTGRCSGSLSGCW